MVDPARCPLCGVDNACGRENDPNGADCWCRSVQFSEALLARVPQAARRKACICARCCAGAESTAAGAGVESPTAG